MEISNRMPITGGSCNHDHLQPYDTSSCEVRINLESTPGSADVLLICSQGFWTAILSLVG